MKYLKRFDENFILESVEDIYKELVNKWKQEQKKLGKNSNPGQGTRNRIMKQAKLQASEKKPEVTKQSTENIDYSKIFFKDMEFHNPQGKVVGKIVNLLSSNKFCSKCGGKMKEGWKFCEECGNKLHNVTYKNYLDNNVYRFFFDEFYNKLKEAGWNNDKKQTIKEPTEIEKPKEITKSKTSTPNSKNSDSKNNVDFDTLCDKYSKMKGADLSRLSLIKKMAQGKEEFVQIAMIQNLIRGIKD